MAIKLVDESEMKKTKGGNENRDDKRWETVAPVACATEKSIVILAAGKIIECERRKTGAPSNCAICEGITKEVFDRCKNKWTDY